MWYVLHCREGQEQPLLESLRRNLTPEALTDAFIFQCERRWRSGGRWETVKKELFPGYLFLESSRPERLSEELEQYRNILRVMEEPGYLIPVGREEEGILRTICGEGHFLKMSYGYRIDGADHITAGPLRDWKGRILRIDWHRRFAKAELSLAGRRSVVWAGVEPDARAIAGLRVESERLNPEMGEADTKIRKSRQ